MSGTRVTVSGEGAEAVVASVGATDLAIVATRGSSSTDASPGVVIELVERFDLAAVIDAMTARPELVAVTGDKRREPIAALARAIAGDDVLAPPASSRDVRRTTIHDHRDKQRVMAEVAAALDQVGLSRLHLKIEQCLEELIMNALFDAPVDAAGKRLFGGMSARSRIAWKTDRSVLLSYTSTAERFSVTVRDAFGSLDRDTVLRFARKCLTSEQAVDRRVEGAGVGLFLVMSQASSLEIRILPSIATEITCTFDADASEPPLRHLAIAVQRDLARHPSPSPARMRRVHPLWPRVVAAGSLIALAIVAVIALLPGPPPKLVEIVSEPAGAWVTVNGRPQGTAPVMIAAADDAGSIEVELAGYQRVVTTIDPEAPRVVVRLERSPDHVRVRIESTPAGAAIRRTGEKLGADRTYTPADVFVEVGKRHAFTLEMPAHAPLDLPPFIPQRGGADRVLAGTLVPR